MSVLLLGRAFYTDLPSHLKLTLLAICDHAHDDGTHVFIGQARLAQKVGTSERSIRTNLAELRKRGYLIRLDEPHPVWHTDQYEIDLTKLPHEEPAISSGPEVDGRTHRKHSVDSTGSPLPPNRQITVSSKEDFLKFWEIYPRRTEKRAAERAFAAALKRSSLDEILAGAQRYREAIWRKPEFTKHPATWLNADCWLDETETAPPPQHEPDYHVAEEPDEEQLAEFAAMVKSMPWVGNA